MDRETLAQALEYADLTSYQADAYLTLLTMGASPAIEVGRESSVPVSQIYDVLRSLESKGYVETIEREKLYVRPCDPDTAMADLETRGELLHDAAEEVRERYQTPKRMDARVGVTKRVETAVESAQNLIDEAETVVEVAGTFEQLESLSSALRAARERGVVVRASVYLDDGQEPDEEFDPNGVISELRACTIPGPFLVVIDRHRTCFAPNTRSDEDYGVLVYDRILPFVFHWYYLTCLWNHYPTVYVDERDRFTYVTIEELIRDCLPLWDEGYNLGVVVEGIDLSTDTEVTVEGTVTDVSFHEDYRRWSRVTLSDLASYKSIALDTDDGIVVVGGWGAVFEDIEMRTVSLVDIDLGETLQTM
ncbi:MULTISPECIES: TrmB family transcriptional regulator [Haloferax]|uniref:TrmB family transcriptional regulator n=2 Tax=Haloferax TaxID=2251 RepID=A0A6G1Z626_9EURY|nr:MULTISPECIES: TrmB family transcriptional regulator [Haloferax]KAB1185366.1 TrmB family transcriptional regulator [Haloferax sp. CBA1149]MRW82006.1 TrmB family transcriptional regulator [Haloferax marinisediminis]